MRKLAALSTALLVAACGQKIDPAAVRDAMPSAAVVQIDAPNPSAAAAAPGAPLARLVGGSPGAAAVAQGPAPLAVTSWLFASAVNGGVFWTLAPIAFLTEFVPPTACTDTACTWGPGAGAEDLNNWMLVVTKRGDAYDYTLSGAPKSPAGSPFVTVISGVAYPGPSRHRGRGSFAVDFDQVWGGLAHPAGAVQQDFGTLSVAYDARAALHLDVTFLDSKNNDDPGADPANPNRTNAVYAFDATATGGDLQLGWRTLPPYTAEYLQQTISLHTRWNAGGAGRGDFNYARPGAEASFSQCWDGAPTFSMSFDGSGVVLTDESVCAFAGAPITITVP